MYSLYLTLGKLDTSVVKEEVTTSGLTSSLVMSLEPRFFCCFNLDISGNSTRGPFKHLQ